SRRPTEMMSMGNGCLVIGKKAKGRERVKTPRKLSVLVRLSSEISTLRMLKRFQPRRPTDCFATPQIIMRSVLPSPTWPVSYFFSSCLRDESIMIPFILCILWTHHRLFMKLLMIHDEARANHLGGLNPLGTTG